MQRIMNIHQMTKASACRLHRVRMQKFPKFLVEIGARTLKINLTLWLRSEGQVCPRSLNGPSGPSGFRGPSGQSSGPSGFSGQRSSLDIYAKILHTTLMFYHGKNAVRHLSTWMNGFTTVAQCQWSSGKTKASYEGRFFQNCSWILSHFDTKQKTVVQIEKNLQQLEFFNLKQVTCWNTLLAGRSLAVDQGVVDQSVSRMKLTWGVWPAVLCVLLTASGKME